MKKLFTRSLLMAGAALLMLSSCKKEGEKVVATSGTPGTLTASATTITLSKANASATAVTFTATKANFGYNAAITNTLQIDLAADKFAAPKEVAITNGSLAYTNLDFNALLLSLGATPGTAASVQTRVKYAISPTIAVYSNVVAMTVTPYALVSFVYVPGAYQGWNPAVADSLISPVSNGTFTGVINFVGSDPGFKITTGKNWSVAYGDAGAGKVSLSGGNLNAPGSGNYQIVLDETANTIAMKAYQFSIIGDGALGWNAGNDIDMKYNNGTQTWSATATLKSSGSIKFRLNHAWDTSYGGANGIASTSAGNIPVPADGTYLVSFSEASLTYTLTKQ